MITFNFTTQSNKFKLQDYLINNMHPTNIHFYIFQQIKSRNDRWVFYNDTFIIAILRFAFYFCV